MSRIFRLARGIGVNDSDRKSVCSPSRFRVSLPVRHLCIPRYDRGLPLIPDGENDTVLPAVRIFGAEIEKAVPTGEVPTQIERVVQCLKDTGLHEEGIFRLSPDSVQVEQIRMSMDRVEYSDNRKRVTYIENNILSELSTQRRDLLALLMDLLRVTSEHAEFNKMHPRNLAAVWTPNLVRCESLEEELKFLATSQKFIEVLI
ncbi:hypothetical protein PSACC_00850, partial [Paramicrosporidium saccamoebae]